MATETRTRKATIDYLNSKGEKASITDSIAQVRFNFAHGETRVIDVKAFPKAILAAAAVRGITEKLRDGYSGAETPQDAVETVDEILATLMDGEWQTKREGGSGVRSTMLLAALEEALVAAGKPWDAQAQRAKLYPGEDATDEEKAQKKALRDATARVPQVAAVLERLKAEAAAKRAAKQDEAPVPTMGLDDLA